MVVRVWDALIKTSKMVFRKKNIDIAKYIILSVARDFISK